MLTPGMNRREAGEPKQPARVSGRVALTLALSVALAAGCATTGPRGFTHVEVERPIAPPLGSDASDARVLATVSWVLTRQLGLPLPWPLGAYFYGSQDAFVDGLVARGGADPGSARE